MYSKCSVLERGGGGLDRVDRGATLDRVDMVDEAMVS